MRKRISIILICIILSISLCACGAQSRPATATEDKDFQKVFGYLEKGEYLKAQEFFEKNIAGSLSKENMASEAFYSYMNAVLRDMSAGKLSADEAMLICEAGNKAGFEMYFSGFEMELEFMQNSMMCFNNGMSYFDSADFENAYLNLAQVLPQDVNYGEAQETIYQIALETADSEFADELLLSEKCLKLIDDHSENYVVSDLKDQGTEKLFKLLHDVSLKSAEALNAERRTLFAAAQYANSAIYSRQLQHLTDDAQKWNEAMLNELNQYAELVREWNTLTEDSSTYYILTEDGIETQGDPPRFTTTHDDYIQLVITYGDQSSYGVIDELGNAKFGIDDSAEDYIDWVELTTGSWRSRESLGIPIKIFLSNWRDSPNAIILYSDGTTDVYSADSLSSYYELQSYNDILDFIELDYYYDNEFAILTKSGEVNCTSAIEWLDLSEWEGITEITVGNASPAGYSGTYIYFDPSTYLYGLDKNGSIHYMEILRESESDQVPESGVFPLDDTVVKIAGSAYLTQSGVLGSVESALNDWLKVNYGDYRFDSIAKANPSSSYYDVIAATATDGEVFLIDLHRAMRNLFE